MRAGKEIKKLLIRVSSIKEPEKIIRKLEEKNSQITVYNKKIAELKALNKSNINEIFTS